jgi:hypothetical protein
MFVPRTLTISNSELFPHSVFIVCSGAHPASYTMDTRGPFPEGKARPGRDAGHSPPSSAEVENE